MKKFTVILLSLLLTLSVFGCTEKGETSDEASSPAESQPAEVSAVIVPEVSKEISDEVTPAPAPADGYASVTVDESGVFRSDYGCGVDIEVRWTLKSTESGRVKLKADIYLLSYSVKVGARYGGSYLDINGEKIYFDTQAVNLEDTQEKEYSFLASVEKDLDLTDDCHLYALTVAFPFRGTYNGVSLPTIEAFTYLNITLDGVVEY